MRYSLPLAQIWSGISKINNLPYEAASSFELCVFVCESVRACVHVCVRVCDSSSAYFSVNVTTCDNLVSLKLLSLCCVTEFTMCVCVHGYMCVSKKRSFYHLSNKPRFLSTFHTVSPIIVSVLSYVLRKIIGEGERGMRGGHDRGMEEEWGGSIWLKQHRYWAVMSLCSPLSHSLSFLSYPSIHPSITFSLKFFKIFSTSSFEPPLLSPTLISFHVFSFRLLFCTFLSFPFQFSPLFLHHPSLYPSISFSDKENLFFP